MTDEELYAARPCKHPGCARLEHPPKMPHATVRQLLAICAIEGLRWGLEMQREREREEKP